MMEKTSRLRPIAAELWGVEHLQRVSAGFALPLRMTVARLGGGELLLHSPVPIDDTLAGELAALGEITTLVAPNAFHYSHLKSAMKRYPQARVMGVPGLAKKLTTTFEDLADPSVPFPDDQLTRIPVRGAPSVDEVLLFHVASRSLVVADYFFNVRATQGWLTPWILRLVGAHGRFAQSRSWRLFAKDRELVAKTAKSVLALDFARVVVGHGEVLEHDAHSVAERALGWLVEPSRKALPSPGGHPI